MRLLRDIVVLVLTVGVSTRVFQWILRKFFRRKEAMYGSYILVIVAVGPFVVYFIGLDVAIAELGLSMMLWIVLDLLWLDYKRKK